MVMGNVAADRVEHAEEEVRHPESRGSLGINEERERPKRGEEERRLRDYSRLGAGDRRGLGI